MTAASITIITVDKCQIIAKHNYRITNVFSVALLTRLIWLIAIVLGLPLLLHNDIFTLHSDQSHFCFTSFCRLDLSGLIPPPSTNSGPLPLLNILVQPTALMLYFSILYFIPLLIIITSHSKTYLYLFQHRHRYSHVHDLQKRIRTSDREAVRMLSVLVVIFGLLWLPFHLIQIASQFMHPLQQDEPQLQLWTVLYIVGRQLTILATCFTPIVYLLFSRPLREQFSNHIGMVYQSILQRSFHKAHTRNYGISCNSTSSTSSSSSTNSSSTNATASSTTYTIPTTASNSEGGNCKKNSLQKLLPENREVNLGLV